MIWQRLCLGALLAGLAAAGGQAADQEGRYAISGAGILRCPQFVEIHGRAQPKPDDGQEADAESLTDYRIAMSWVSGFLTATNEHANDTFDIVSWQTPDLIGHLIDDFCRRNNDATLAEATGAMVRAFSTQRLETLSEKVPIKQGERQVAIYKEALRQVQAGLIKVGVLTGKADGVYGPGTKAALERYQRDNELEVTGLPDQRTLVHLFYQNPALRPPEAQGQPNG